MMLDWKYRMLRFVDVDTIRDTYVIKPIIPEDRTVFQSPLYLTVLCIWLPDASVKTSGQPIHRFWTRKFPDGCREVGENPSHNDVE
jgi:hypothetical protein